MQGTANFLVATTLAGEAFMFYAVLGWFGVFVFAVTTIIYSGVINEGSRTWIKGLLLSK